MPPSRCCSSVNEALKSALKSLPDEDAQGNLPPIRRLYACTFASGARDTAASVTSWLARCTAKPLNPSAIVEQVAHPAVRSEEHTSELQSQSNLVCRLLLEKKKKIQIKQQTPPLRVSYDS